MATTLREKMKGLPAERRARIDAETDRLHAYLYQRSRKKPASRERRQEAREKGKSHGPN